MLSKLLVIILVFIFGLSMFAAGLLAPDGYRDRARGWMHELAAGLHKADDSKETAANDNDAN